MNKPGMDNQHSSMNRKQLFHGIYLKCAQPSEKRKGSQSVTTTKKSYMQTELGPRIVFKIEKMFQVPGMTVWEYEYVCVKSSEV